MTVSHVFAILVAFAAGWLGGRWTVARAVWADHKDTRAKEQRLRAARWVAWRRVALPVSAVMVAVWLAGRVGH